MHGHEAACISHIPCKQSYVPKHCYQMAAGIHCFLPKILIWDWLVKSDIGASLNRAVGYWELLQQNS